MLIYDMDEGYHINDEYSAKYEIAGYIEHMKQVLFLLSD